MIYLQSQVFISKAKAAKHTERENFSTCYNLIQKNVDIISNPKPATGRPFGYHFVGGSNWDFFLMGIFH
jgi:hypothetical protein